MIDYGIIQVKRMKRVFCQGIKLLYMITWVIKNSQSDIIIIINEEKNYPQYILEAYTDRNQLTS